MKQRVACSPQGDQGSVVTNVAKTKTVIDVLKHEQTSFKAQLTLFSTDCRFLQAAKKLLRVAPTGCK